MLDGVFRGFPIERRILAQQVVVVIFLIIGIF